MRTAIANQRSVQLRADGEERIISGYAAVFYDGSAGTEFSMRGGKLKERIAPSAFDGLLKEDVFATYNHDPNQALGRSTSGTLRFSVDGNGVPYEIDVPDTQVGRDVSTLVERGDVRGSSFIFMPGDYERSEEGETRIITHTRFERLIEMGPVLNPAYKGTAAKLRSEFEERIWHDFDESDAKVRQIMKDRAAAAMAIVDLGG